MRVWMFVYDIQIDDMAPRDDELRILREEFCKVGDVEEMMPTLDTEVTKVEFSREGRKEIVETGEGRYRITGEILDGYEFFGYCGYCKGKVHLVIDAGILIRVGVNYPIKHAKIGSRCVPLVLSDDDEPRTIVIRKSDYITIESVSIDAMWLEMWSGDISVKFRGRIVDRRMTEDGNMWILVEPLPMKKEYELCISPKPDARRQILRYDGKITITYPARKT